MTKKFLDPTLQIAQTIKLTPELVMRLNLGAIVYGEQTRHRWHGRHSVC
jgi:hypothetical protein